MVRIKILIIMIMIIMEFIFNNQSIIRYDIVRWLQFRMECVKIILYNNFKVVYCPLLKICIISSN